VGKSRTNFARGEQKKYVGHDEDDEDFDWRKTLEAEEKEEREYQKRIKELGLDSELGRKADELEEGITDMDHDYPEEI